MPNCSFTDALHTKYGEEVEESVKGACEIFVVGSAPGRASPSGRLVLPRVLTLNCCGIDRTGNSSKISELCHNVEELDLAQNHLSDMFEVSSIISQMPNLLFLNLSHNDFEDSTPVTLSKMDNIRSLVLNHTYVPWPVVTSTLDAMPKIQELHLSLNNYATIEISPEKCYPSVKQLYISGNPLSSWEAVVQVGRAFPNLESLVMADTDMETIPEPSTWNLFFQSLRCLNISNNNLTEWSDVDRLNSFSKLEDVRLQGLPVLEGYIEKERRQHLIARLPSVSRLNGSPVFEKEKEDAERAFIRYFMDKEDKPNRFYELEAIHGKLDPLVDIDLSPKQTACVVVRFHEVQQELVVNLQHSVQELKVQLSQMCGLLPTKMRVFYIDHEMAEIIGPEELKINSKKLYTYNIQDKDEFLVDSK